MAKKKTSKTAKKMELTLVKEKETKGAIRYMEDTEDYPKNIYFRKDELEEVFGDWPETLKVVVSEG